MEPINNFYRLTADDIDKASAALRDAFIDYPAFKYLFPDINDRRKKLRHVMIFFLKRGLLHGEVLAPSKNIEAVSIWYKSGNLNTGLHSLLKAGLIGTICNLNIKAFIRLKKLGDAKKFNREMMLDKEYYLLDMIGTNRAFEKQGYAKLLIDTMIEKADKERMGCFLETSNIKNIDYYSKYGFILSGKYRHNGLESFCMIKNSCEN